jgi:hypothetical protein
MAVDYDEMLRSAKAPWQEDGFGIRGPHVEAARSTLSGSELPGPQSASVPHYRNPDRAVPRPLIPDVAVPSLPTLAPPPGTSGPSTIYSFMMEDATDNEGAKVLIHDGEVSANGGDGQLPPGMGNDDYILPVNADGDDVWVEVTYDTDTLAITSLSIGTGT